MGRRRGIATVVGCLCAAVLLTPGCDDGGKPKMIEWDFSQAHRPEDAGWELSDDERADDDVDATQVDPVSSVRIKLPEGKTFTADAHVRDIILNREGTLLDHLQVTFDEQTAEAAYKRAAALAGEWGLEGRNIDRWFAEAKGKTGSDAADVDVSGAFAETPDTAPDEGRIGPGGPSVTVQIRYSFDDDRPFLVGFELSWPTGAGDQPGA